MRPGLSPLAKELMKELLGSLFAVGRYEDRFRLGPGVKNEALFVQSAERIPIVTFPRPCAELFLKCRQVHEGNGHFVDSVEVWFHVGIRRGTRR